MASSPASAPSSFAQQLLRWALVLPAAALAASIAHIIAGVVIQIFATGWNIPPEYGVIYWIRFAMFYLPRKAAFVLGGALTAPAYRLPTAFVLAAIAGLASISVHILSQRTIGRVNYLHLAAECAGIALGLLSLALIPKQKPPENLTDTTVHAD